MEEEIVKTNPENVSEDYIEQLQKLKANSVPKEEFDKVRADNKKMLDILFSGADPTPVPSPEPKEEVDVQALRNELYGGRYEGSDLDYATKVLKLRKALMDRGEKDPAVSSGQKTTPEDYDYENCESVCQQIQECIDYANGDNEVFRAELMRRVNKK